VQVSTEDADDSGVETAAAGAVVTAATAVEVVSRAGQLVTSGPQEVMV